MNFQNAGPGWGPPPGHGAPPPHPVPPPPSNGRRLLLVVVAVVITLGVCAAVGFAFHSGGDSPIAAPGFPDASSGLPSSAPATQTTVTNRDEERMRRLCDVVQRVGATYVPNGKLDENGGTSVDDNRIGAQCDLLTDGQSAVDGYLVVDAATFAPLAGSPAPARACQTRLADTNSNNPLPAIVSGENPTFAGVIERIVRKGTVRMCAGDLLLQVEYSLTRYRPSPARPVLADAELLVQTRTITNALVSALS